MKLYITDIGTLGKENLVYLNENGLLVKDEAGQIVISDNLVYSQELDRPIQLYSLFRHVYDRIAEHTGLKTCDEVVTCMRSGSVAGRNFDLEPVMSIREEGFQVIRESQINAGTKVKSKF